MFNYIIIYNSSKKKFQFSRFSEKVEFLVISKMAEVTSFRNIVLEVKVKVINQQNVERWQQTSIEKLTV